MGRNNRYKGTERTQIHFLSDVLVAVASLDVVYARGPASFWRENVVAVEIQLRVFARMSRWRKQVIKCQKFYRFAIEKARKLLH